MDSGIEERTEGSKRPWPRGPPDLETFLEPVASFSLSMSPWRAMGTHFVTKTMGLATQICNLYVLVGVLDPNM